MRYLIAALVLIFVGLPIRGQGQVEDQSKVESREGRVSFVTSQSVYVRFNFMQGISEGDTLFISQDNQMVPALQIKNLSSISCVCIPLAANTFKVSDAVYAILIPEISQKTLPGSVALLTTGDNDRDSVAGTISPQGDTASEDVAKMAGDKQMIHGRLSVSSYTNTSSNTTSRRQRMRYTFSLNANKLGNSGFSAETYLSFAHTNTNWEDVKSNLFNGLKIYNLSLKYDFNETMYISLGRKINPILSSVGAIDGLQFEKRFRSLTLGAFAGSRPDYQDYSINPDLLQYGTYLGHDLQGKRLSMQNSLAFIEQTNKSMTDRRFMYFQHSSWLMKNLSLFGSAEMDLYKRVNEISENTFTLTNVYLSLRYRIIRPLSMGISYSSRQNIIYYEAYKDFVERLLEKESLQGWRFRINARPAKHISLGVSAGHRYRKEDIQPSNNINGYATFSRVPWINAALTVSATWLETNYLSGNIYSVGLNRDIVPQKLSGGLKYRYVDYRFSRSEGVQEQNVFEANLFWSIYKKLSLSVYYEGTFESAVTYNRLYINLSQRF